MHQRKTTAPRLCAVALVALATLSLPASPAHAYELEVQLGLFNRFTMRRNAVERFLRFDPARRAFDTQSFVNPTRDDTFYSFVATAGMYLGLTRWLGFGLTVGSGELRPRGRVASTTTVSMPNAIAQRIGDPVVLSTDDTRSATANGQAVKSEAQQTGMVRQAFIRLMAPGSEWFYVEAGRRDLVVADGLIYNDYGLGVSVVADLQKKFKTGAPRFSLGAILPTRSWTEGLSSPLLQARVSWAFNKLESIGLFFAYFHDGDNNFGRLLDPLLGEVAVNSAASAANLTRHGQLFALTSTLSPNSSADIYWLGFSGNKIFGNLMISASALVQLGHLSLSNPLPEVTQVLSRAGLNLGALGSNDSEVRLPTLGFAVDAGIRYLLNKHMIIGGWFLYLSGAPNPFLDGQDALGGRYGGFLSVVPYITRTNIFFSGGLNETFTGRSTSTAGLNARGVISGGLTWELDYKRLSVSTTAATLFSDVASWTGGRFYGVELDAEASFRITSWLGVSAEYDVLLPGDYFREQRPIHQVLVGLDFTLGYHKK